MTAVPISLELKEWRRAERERLIALRLKQPAEIRAAWTEKIAAALLPMLKEAKGAISFYWPFKGEPDLRPLMRQLAAADMQLALPVVVTKGQPLQFRPWSPGCKMVPGIWNIPVPDTTETVIPAILLAPVVGYDPRGFRLGYGGGYFDRTLAQLHGDRQVFGIGYDCAEIPTIHPQGHDIPMTMIVTQSGRVVN
jgi:5,10-methenyltetrahydrofolate synthetase